MKTRGLFGLALVLAIMLSAGAVRAETTTTFTTTANFDTGAYTISGGNREVNSNSCNPGVTVDSIELDSLKGDSFCVADADADTFKWNLFSSGTCESVTRVITGGVLDLDAECTTGGNRGVTSSVSITGDWDIRVKVDKTQDVGTTNQWLFSSYNGANDGTCTLLADGVLYAIVDSNIQAYTCVNSVFVQVGTNTVVPSDPVWLRITRVAATDVYTYLYSTNGSSWTQDEQTTNALIINPGFVYIQIFSDTASEPTGADWDDFHVATGTLSAGGFQSQGTWTSANQVSTTERFRFLNMTYSGVSASNYITAVSLLNGAGSTVYVDNTDRISGVSASYSVPEILISGTWNVRVNFTGAGSGTGNLGSVSVNSFTPTPVCAFGPLGEVLDILIPILITAGMILAFVTFFLGTSRENMHRDGFIPVMFGVISVIFIVILTTLLLPSIAVCN